jgi:hypothetical protein
MSAFADIQLAKSPEDVTRFLEDNQDNTAGLLFFDSTAKEPGDSGFWGGVITSITHVFSAEDEGGNGGHVATVEEDISTDAELMRIDVSHEDFREIQESYDVAAVPFLILFKKGIPVLREVPNAETHDKILEVLNVAPAVIVPTVAPGPVASPAATQTRRVAQESRPRLNPNQKCTDVTNYEADSAGHWRDTPFYIKELEDYEIPEDWWRHGYIAANDTLERQRRVQWSEDEYITPERPGFIEPVSPVRPYKAAIFGPEPVVRVAPEPRVRVAPEPTVRMRAPISTSEERLVNVREVPSQGPTSGRQVVPGLVAGQIINPNIAPRHYHGAINAINNATHANQRKQAPVALNAVPTHTQTVPRSAPTGPYTAPTRPTSDPRKPVSTPTPTPATSPAKSTTISGPRTAPTAPSVSTRGGSTNRTSLPSNRPTGTTAPSSGPTVAGQTGHARPTSGTSASSGPSRPISGPTAASSRPSSGTQIPVPPSSR